METEKEEHLKRSVCSTCPGYDEKEGVRWNYGLSHKQYQKWLMKWNLI